MSCIVGIKDKNRVILGADSIAIGEQDFRIRTDPKIFKHGNIIIGFAGSFRAGQLIQYNLPTFKPPKKNLTKWMVLTFIPRIKKILEEEVVNESPDAGGGKGYPVELLVGVRDTLFFVGGDLQVGLETPEYGAIGAGGSYALGSLATSSGEAQGRLLKALQVSEQFCAAVKSPFHFISTEEA